MSSSFDTIPKPENMDRRLLMSVWFIAPKRGVEMRYVANKRTVPVISIIQGAADKMLRKIYVATAAMAEARNILAEFQISGFAL